MSEEKNNEKIERIKEFRQKHGLKQKELAVILGVELTTVGRWESGMRDVPAWALKFIRVLDLYLEKGGSLEDIQKQ